MLKRAYLVPIFRPNALMHFFNKPLNRGKIKKSRLVGGAHMFQYHSVQNIHAQHVIHEIFILFAAAYNLSYFLRRLRGQVLVTVYEQKPIMTHKTQTTVAYRAKIRN